MRDGVDEAFVLLIPLDPPRSLWLHTLYLTWSICGQYASCVSAAGQTRTWPKLQTLHLQSMTTRTRGAAQLGSDAQGWEELSKGKRSGLTDGVAGGCVWNCSLHIRRALARPIRPCFCAIVLYEGPISALFKHANINCNELCSMGMQDYIGETMTLYVREWLNVRNATMDR